MQPYRGIYENRSCWTRELNWKFVENSCLKEKLDSRVFFTADYWVNDKKCSRNVSEKKLICCGKNFSCGWLMNWTFAWVFTEKKQIENGFLNQLTEEHLFCLRVEDFCIWGLINSIDVESCFCKDCLSLVFFYWIPTEINQLIIPYISVEGKRGLWKSLNRQRNYLQKHLTCGHLDRYWEVGRR